jgi:subtilisin family serine protease
MPTKYLILRVEPDHGDVLLGAIPTRRGDTGGLTIATVDGHETDVGELRADPRNAAVMDADVALALIEPKLKVAANLATLKQLGVVRMPEGLVAVGAHTTPFTGQGVSVAILDTGIDETHPTFQNTTIVKKDLTGEGIDEHDVRDNDGHGTHCAATICGAPVDDIRVGVAPGVVKLCVGRVFGKGGCTLEMLLKGMFWAVLEQKASVVSMSLSYDLARNTKRMIAKGVDPALAAQAAMRQQSDIIKGISKLRGFLESQSPNVVFVAATGNESERPTFVLDAGLPAAELLPVGAVGARADNWDIAPFSNGRAEVVAPGVDVLSAAPGGGWSVMSGTSMATPHVAGIAALWTEKLRNEGVLSVPEAVRSAIKSHAVRKPLLTTDINAIGMGLVQAPQ